MKFPFTEESLNGKLHFLCRGCLAAFVHKSLKSARFHKGYSKSQAESPQTSKMEGFTNMINNF